MEEKTNMQELKDRLNAQNANSAKKKTAAKPVETNTTVPENGDDCKAKESVDGEGQIVADQPEKLDETPLEEETNATEEEKQGKAGLFSTKNIAVMATLAAVAYVLYLIPHFVPIFSLPMIFPGWLDVQVSDLPALLGGFAMGPVAAAIIIVVKCVLKMPFTSTSCTGELADILVGLAFVVPAAVIYGKIHSKKGAVLGMLVGSACAIVVAALANRFALIPFYAYFQFSNHDYALGMQTLTEAVKTLYPKATPDTFYTFYIWLAVVPFNLLRCALCSFLTALTYKPLSKYLHRA